MKITVLDGGIINPGDLQWSPITSIAETTIYEETLPTEIAERTADADVVVVNRLSLPSEVVAQIGEKVRLVSIMGTSADLVAVQALEKRGIAVCNVQGYSSEDAAQHTMALMLELFRHIGLHSDSVHRGEWTERNTWSYWLTPPICLDKKVLGLVGFGSIGRRVSRLANAFGMEILACCRTPRNPPSYGPFSFVSMDTLLQRADVISLHCPLTNETRGMICQKSIARMKDGVYLINISHGGLVNQEDCAAALRSGKIAAMGTDVLAHEPPNAEDALLHAPNVLITPHMAWASRTTRQRLVNLTGENIRRWMQGTPVNLLTRIRKG